MGKKTDTKKPATPAKRAVKTPPAAEPVAVPEPPAPKAKKAAPKPAAKPAELVTPAKAPKTVPTAKPAKASKPKAAKPAKAKPAYTHDDIALRAYFIAERRQKEGLPGSESQDWIAAEKELAAEAKAAKKPKAKAS